MTNKCIKIFKRGKSVEGTYWVMFGCRKKRIRSYYQAIGLEGIKWRGDTAFERHTLGKEIPIEKIPKELKSVIMKDVEKRQKGW